MKLEGHYNVLAPRVSVWAVLQDPKLLARVLPGCEKLEQIDENTYNGIVKIQVGPLQGTFNGKIVLSDIVAPESYTMSFDGKGALGFVKGVGRVSLTEENSATKVLYAGDANIGGKIAAVGQRLMESSARALIEQTFDLLTPIAQALTSPATPSNGTAQPSSSDASPAPPLLNMDSVAVRRPSQVEFGMGILKHMFEDTVPEQYRTPVLVGLALVVVLILVSIRDALFDQ